MKFILAFSILTCFLTGQAAPLKTPVSEETLQQCYKSHPILMKLLVSVDDKEFENQKAGKVRTAVIKKDFEKDPTGLRSCVENVIQFAKEQNDPENLQFVALRMKEVTGIVYSGHLTPQAPSKTSR